MRCACVEPELGFGGIWAAVKISLVEARLCFR
jgi:hypothetical protein